MRSKMKVENSISKKLLIINITVFIIITIITLISLNNILSNPNNTSNLISISDKVYVEVSQNFNLSSDSAESYVNSLGELYDINIVIAYPNGDIKLKTEGINEEKIKIDEIINNKVYKNGDSDYFTRLYNIKNDDDKLVLITYKDRKVLSDILKAWINLIMPICSVLLVVYLITLKKLRELIYICNGIVKIGSEDLNYKLNKKSNDEFGVLVDEINKMSYALKSKIENEKNVYKFKNDLITNISHDLRTPLTSLVGYIQLVSNENISEVQRREYIKRSLTKAERIQILISELFEYSKLESGEVKLEKYNINIIEMLEQCIGEYSNLAIKRKLDIIKKYDVSELLVLVDCDLLIRVVENILDNAIKYSRDNSKVYINVNNEKDSIIITFENTSNELINYDVNRLFERFYRIDEARNQEISGSGLGLFIAKSIVELHKGDIWIETKGDNFKIYIKLLKE